VFPVFLGCASSVTWFVPERSQVDAQLLCFLVEVAALEAKRLGGVGDVELMALQLGQDDLALKTLRTFS
jgi:hypothetical protein